MTQLRVFVSHSSQDKAFADALVQGLREAGADVWYDEQNLGAGVLRDEIMRELADRPVFVVLLSKAAFGSSWVRDECEWAYNLYRRKPERLILPVAAAAYDRDDFDRLLYLEGLKRVEAAGNTPYSQAEAIDRTLRLLALTPQGQTPAPATPQLAMGAADLIALGKAFAAQEQYVAAITFLETATELEPSNEGAWFNLGYANGEARRWQESLVAYERALAINPNDSISWNNMGMTLNELKRYDEALAALDRALALDPNNANAWSNKGAALWGLSRDEEAVAAYDRALTLDPDYPDGWYNKGGALWRLGRNEEALAAFDRALALKPDYADAWVGKGFALVYLHCDEEALAAFDRALAIDPDHASRLGRQGLLLVPPGTTRGGAGGPGPRASHQPQRPQCVDESGHHPERRGALHRGHSGI